MTEGHKSPESTSENMYEPAGLISDYFNELTSVTVEEGKIRRDGKVRTVEERYITDTRHSTYSEAHRNIVTERPKKVARINQMAEILNTTDDVTTFKRAFNEVMRLIYTNAKKYGEQNNEYFYPEPEFGPDLLGK